MADEKPANDHEEDHQQLLASGPTFPEYVGSILPFAGLFDLLSIIPGWNVPNVFIGQFVMSVIWLFHGVIPWDKKNWVWYFTSWICEFIPLVSLLPMFMVESMRFYAILEARKRIGVLSLAARANKMKAYVRLQMMKNKDFLEKSREQVVAKAGPERAQRIDDKRRDLNTALSGNSRDGKNKEGRAPLVDRLPAFMTPRKSSGKSGAANDNAPAPTAANDNDPNSGVVRDAA